MSLLDHPYVQRLVGAGLHSLFDPNPIRFAPTHRSGTRPLQRMIGRSETLYEALPDPLIRNRFLYGCKIALDGEEVEHLIVGFGNKRASTTDITHVAHIVGQSGSVGIPPELQAMISVHLQAAARAEIVIVHNHPEWWANTVLNNRPVASPEDRDTLVAQRYGNPRSLVRVLFRKGGVRLFLVENGKVREIRTPNWSTVANS